MDKASDYVLTVFDKFLDRVWEAQSDMTQEEWVATLESMREKLEEMKAEY